jgi:hypothetical protein
LALIKHHRHVAQPGVGGQLAAHLVAVHLGHDEVEQDQIGAVGPSRGQAGLAVGRRLDREAGLGQHQLHHPDDGRAVVDHQDAGRCHGAASYKNDRGAAAGTDVGVCRRCGDRSGVWSG